MLKKFGQRTRLAIYLLLIGIVILAGLAFWEKNLQSEVISKLEATHAEKKTAIEDFFRKQVDYITTFSTEKNVLAAMQQANEIYEQNGVDDQKIFSTSLRKYESNLKRFAGMRRYHNLLLVNNDGTILYTTKDEKIFGQNLLNSELKTTLLSQVFQRAKNGEVFISDLAFFSPSKKEAMFIAKAIRNETEELGILICEWTLGSLNRIVSRSTKLAETEDTYLIGSDLLMRSNSRLSKAPTALQEKVDTTSASKLFNDESGLIETQNYNQKKVLSAFAPIEALNLDWGIITEVRKSDVLSLTIQLRYLAIFLLACGFAIIISIPYLPAKYKNKQYWKDTFWAYLYLLPVFVILGIFVFYPVVKSFLMSFYDWDLISAKTYIGLDNYKELFNDKIFQKAIVNTSYFVFVSVPVTIIISLFIAILLNSKIKARSWYRLAFFIPWITSPVAATMVWKWIFNYNNYGLLNYLLLKLSHLANWLAHIVSLGGIDHWISFTPIDWLNTPSLTIPNLIILSVWKMMGYNIVIFLAGLQNVPKELYEAAEVDGASRWQRFRHITIPLISPTTFFISIISIIGAFKIFTQVFVLYNGGPGLLNSGMTMVFYIYSKAFIDWRMGYASAGAYILFFIIFAFTLVQMWFSKKRVHYS